MANEPTDLRVVSITRGGDGTVAMVVALPKPVVTGAGAPGAITVDAPNGASLTPSVSPLPPSATAVAVLLHTAGADVVTARRATGVTAELLRSLDPAVAVTVVSTTGVVVAPLGIDRGATLSALSRPVPDAAVTFPAALGAVGAQLGGRGYVEPLVVVVDAAADDTNGRLPTDALAPAGMVWRIIPFGPAPSPLVAQFAQRVGLAMPAPSDPIALVDDAVGIVNGRFALHFPDPGGTGVTVRVRGGGAELTARVNLAAAPSSTTDPPTTATAPVTTAVATTAGRPTTSAVVLAEQSTVAAVVAPPGPPSKGTSTSSWWIPVVGGALAVLAVAGGALLFAWRRSAGRSGAAEIPPDEASDGTSSDGPVPVRAPGYSYVDLSEPLPSGAVKSRPRREIVARAPAADNGASSAISFERKRRLLALAEELGNVSEACRVMGVSRRSYYEWKRIADEHGIDALRPKREWLRGPQH